MNLYILAKLNKLIRGSARQDVSGSVSREESLYENRMMIVDDGSWGRPTLKQALLYVFQVYDILYTNLLR